MDTKNDGGAALSEARDSLNKLRSLLDDADATPFGQMSKRLDEMAAHCDKALSIVEAQI